MKRFVFVVLVLVFLFGCTTQEDAVTRVGEQAVVEPMETVGETNGATTETAGVKEFTMIAKQWEFIPHVINVNKGDTVRLLITSIDVPHGFELPAYQIDERLEPNQEVEVEFVADREGLFFFRCNVYCGRGHTAMVGRVVVT